MKPLQLRLKMIVFKITIKWNLTQSHAISFCCSSFILRVALLYQMSLYLADFNDCFFFLFASPVVTVSGYLSFQLV